MMSEDRQRTQPVTPQQAGQPPAAGAGRGYGAAGAPGGAGAAAAPSGAGAPTAQQPQSPRPGAPGGQRPAAPVPGAPVAPPAPTLAETANQVRGLQAWMSDLVGK